MSVPIQWRTKKQRYSLQGGLCPKCSNIVFPPRGACPFCSREEASKSHRVNPLRSVRATHVEPLVFVAPVHIGQPMVAVGDD